MNIRYQVITVYPEGIELLRLSSPAFSGAVLQGPAAAAPRLRHAVTAARALYPGFPQSLLKPLSLYTRDDLVCALYELRPLALLPDFLDKADVQEQYAAGKRCGFLFHALHQQARELVRRQPVRSGHPTWAQTVKNELLSYFKSPYRFSDDACAIQALQDRLNFLLDLPVTCSLGALRSDRLFVDGDGELVLSPLFALRHAPGVRDFALLSAIDGGSHPCFAAGVVDGCFGLQDKTQFWLQLAVYAAYYATAGLIGKLEREARSAQAAGGQQLKALEDRLREAERRSQQLRADFKDFTYPIPRWYCSKEAESCRAAAAQHGW